MGRDDPTLGKVLRKVAYQLPLGQVGGPIGAAFHGARVIGGRPAITRGFRTTDAYARRRHWLRAVRRSHDHIRF